MSRRRKRGSKKGPATAAPEMTGILGLLSEMPAETLDLHGYTAAQARLRVHDFLTACGRVSAGSVVHIITGKGANSEGDAVLLGLVRQMVDDEVGGHVKEFAGMVGGGGWVIRVA